MIVHGKAITAENALAIPLEHITELENVPGIVDSVIKEVIAQMKIRNDGLAGIITSGDPLVGGEPIFGKVAESISEDYYGVLKNSSAQLNEMINLAETRESDELRELKDALIEAGYNYKKKCDSIWDEITELENDKGEEGTEPPDHSEEIKAKKADYDEQKALYDACLEKIKEVDEAKSKMHSKYGIKIDYNEESKSISVTGGINPSTAASLSSNILDGDGYTVGYVSTGTDENGNYFVIRKEPNEDGSFYTATYTYEGGPDGKLLSKKMDYWNGQRSVEIGYNPTGGSDVTVTVKNEDGSTTTYKTSYDPSGKPSQDTKVIRTSKDGTVTEETVLTSTLTESGTEVSPLASEDELSKPESSEAAASTEYGGTKKSEDETGADEKKDDEAKDEDERPKFVVMDSQGNPMQVEINGTPDYRVVQVGYQYQVVDANNKVIKVCDNYSAAFNFANSRVTSAGGTGDYQSVVVEVPNPTKFVVMNQQGNPMQVEINGTPDYRVVQVGYQYQVVDANNRLIREYDSYDDAFKFVKLEYGHHKGIEVPYVVVEQPSIPATFIVMNQQGKPVQVRVDGTPDYRVVQVGYQYQVVDANNRLIREYDSYDDAFKFVKLEYGHHKGIDIPYVVVEQPSISK